MFGGRAVVGSGLFVVMQSCQVVFEPSGGINSGAVRGVPSRVVAGTLSEGGPAVTLG